MASPNYKLKKYLDFTVIMLVFAFPVFRLIPWPEHLQLSDFIEYYAVSNLMHTGQYNQIYNDVMVQNLEHVLVPNTTHSYLPFLVSPLLAWIVYPLAYFKTEVSLYIWTGILWFTVIVSYMILCQTFHIEGRKKIWWAVFIATSGPFIEAIRLGQLSPILLLGLTLVLNKPRSAASVIGQSLLWLKPHLLLPLLAFEINTPLRLLAVLTCLAGVLGLLISCLLGGFSIVPNYLHLLESAEIHGNLLGLIYGPTLRGQLLKFSCDQHLAVKIATAIYSLLLVFSLLLSSKIKRLSSNTGFTAILPITLCLSPHLHNYDLLLLIPSIFLLSSYSLSGSLFRLRLFIISLLALVFLLPVYIILHYFYVASGGLINPFFWSVLIFGIGALIIEWHRPNV